MKTASRIISALLLGLASLTMQAQSDAHSWCEKSALAEGRWVKIALSDNYDGIYQINYSQLRAWGFSSPEKVGVFGFGGHPLSESFAGGHYDDVPEMAVLHDTANKRILFYGRGLVEWQYQDATFGYTHRWNTYSNQACYFLHEVTDDSPKSLPLQERPDFSAQTSVSTFDYCLLHENNNINIGETGKEFYGESFLSSRVQKFDMLLNHSLNANSALLTVNFVAYSNQSNTLTASINGKSAGSTSISAVTASYTFANEGTINTPLSDWNDLDDATVSLTYNTSDATPKVARLNYIRLQGKSPLCISDKEGYLLFRSSEARHQTVQYAISGMSAHMQVWDVTDPTHIVRQQTDETGSFVAAQSGIREYAIVNPASTSGFPGVTFVGEVKAQNLHGTPGANLVIVSAPGFMTQAQTLADYRRNKEGLSVLIVTPEQIYNEYASGTPDATAIRLFMKQMYDRQQRHDLTSEQQLRYLLLLGDGSFDNRRNALSNYQLLTYQSDASLRETSSCTCDDYFGFLDDDEGSKTAGQSQYSISGDRLDIGIGRLPANTVAEAEGMVGKIIRYSENRYLGSWKNRMVFLSDDDKMDNSGHDSPNLHIKHNEQLVKSLQRKGHHEIIYQKIYLPAYQHVTSAAGTEYPDAKKEFLEALQQGTMMVNYAGHGAAANITHENLMNTALAWNLRMKNLPLWIFASCDVSRWDASETSMGEALMLNADGGAVAVIGAARIVYASNNLVLNQGIADHLFDRHSDGTRFRLGDILKAAKLQTGSDFNKLNYALLGDPSMMLTLPQQEVLTEEVRYGDKVSVSGRVLLPGSQETDTLFNGLIYPTVYGAEDNLTADKGLWQEPLYTFASRNKKVFSGRDIVSRGKFAFSFQLPSDVTASDAGLVNLYVCSEEGDEGCGFYNNFAITANSSNRDDVTGPEITAMFLNAPSFQSGDRVGTTPFFYAEVHDESGFNTTGNDIGHDITLIVRSLSNTLLKPQQYVLNNYFTTFTGDATTGNVKYSLSALEEGRYEATFRIWDNNSNPTTQRFEFVVDASEAPRVELVQAYPSPARQGSEVTFRVMHNRPESADELHLQIYTQMGVKVLDKVVKSASADVVYLQEGTTDKTDISKELNGDETSQLMGCSTTTWTATVAPGVYMYRIFLKSDQGETITKAKKLIVY